MRISDWSSDVCSSDLYPLGVRDRNPGDPWKIVGERPQAIGACEQADEDEPDDRVDAQPVERGNDKPRAAEHNQSFTKAGGVDRPGHWFILAAARATYRSEEHTSELQSIMRISYAVLSL